MATTDYRINLEQRDRTGFISELEAEQIVHLGGRRSVFITVDNAGDSATILIDREQAAQLRDFLNGALEADLSASRGAETAGSVNA